MKDNQGKELWETIIKLKKTMAKFHHVEGIPQPAFMVMHRIKRNAVCNDDNQQVIKMSELSKLMHISRPATTQLINDLELKGFVKRIFTKDDRRVVYVCLTKEGSDMLDSSEKTVFTMLAKITENLGEYDTAELIRLLNKLIETFADIEFYNN